MAVDSGGQVSSRPIETLLEGGNFFECPRWHDGRWFITDIFRPGIITLREDGSDLQDHALFEKMVSGTGWLPSGSLLVVVIEDRRVLRIDTSGEVSEYVALSGLGAGIANDMVVDSSGRAYVGLIGIHPDDIEMGGDRPAGVVVRVDPDGTQAVVADGLLGPNGMVVTPDGATLIVGESLGSRYTAFDVAGDGSLGGRRIWAQLQYVNGKDAAPDGCGLDAEGRIWFADSFTGRFVLVAEGGKIIEELEAPRDLNVYACMLGGSDGRSLVMCCGPGHSATERASGQSVLFVAHVDVPHAGLP